MTEQGFLHQIVEENSKFQHEKFEDYQTIRIGAVSSF
jgi:hypothetical protein